MSIAQGHGAVSWELRAAISLARLLAGHGRRAEALVALADAVSRMADTADLRTARRLLAAG